MNNPNKRHHPYSIKAEKILKVLKGLTHRDIHQILRIVETSVSVGSRFMETPKWKGRHLG